MNIYGEKVVLRAITSEDTNILLELINDPEVEKYLGGKSFPVSKEAQANWIAGLGSRNDCVRLMIAPKERELEAVGTVILSDIDNINGTAQIHIKLSSNVGQGKGFGTDTIKTMVSYAFTELRLNCIYSEVLENNERSQHVFEKCGFEREGLLRHRVYKDGTFINVVPFSIIKGER